MRRISLYMVTVLIIVFAFTSVAWAGPAVSRDLQQLQVTGDNSTPLAQKDHKGGHGGGAKHHGGGSVKHHGGGHGGGDKHGGGHGGGIKHKGGHDGIKHKGGHDGIKHKGHHDGIKHHGGHGRHHDRHRHHHWGRDWHSHWHGGHHFHDWDWFVGFGIIALGAYCIAENAEETIYVHFETENRTYFREVSQRYGDYIYRERIAGFGGEGWRYFWVDSENVVCVFVRDDGYTHTFIWSRADAGAQAVAINLLTAAQLAAYDGYAADMPAALAQEYIGIVMWSQTEWK